MYLEVRLVCPGFSRSRILGFVKMSFMRPRKAGWAECHFLLEWPEEGVGLAAADCCTADTSVLEWLEW